jgi:hypothetical protein
MEQEVRYKFRESWILFVFAVIVLALFSYTPNWRITCPIGIVLAYLIIRPFRYVKVYSQFVEIDKPFAFKKFTIPFTSFTRIRHQPPALGNPSAIIFYYHNDNKEKKLAFSSWLGAPIEKILLEAKPGMKIIEGFDD